VTPAQFVQAANVSRETLARLTTYNDLLAKWQARINLVGPATIPDSWERHFLDSAQLYPLLPGSAHLVLYDLGTGAGFPGLVLAIMAAGAGRKIETHLVESDQRKCAFLGEVARETGLARAVTIHATRAERLPPNTAKSANVVTARALAPLSELLTLAAPLLDIHGICLFPKGVKAEGELTQAAKDWKMRVDRLPSRTDAAGTILRIADLHRT
jgi:16S rRNA (guanine527-N7)-methyltransferase